MTAARPGSNPGSPGMEARVFPVSRRGTTIGVGNGIGRTGLHLKSGGYPFRLRIEGEWRDDSQATRRAPEPRGSEDSD